MSDPDRMFEQARSGNPKAINTILSRLQPRLAQFVSTKMGAERRWIESGDLVQQVLLESLRILPRLPRHAGYRELEQWLVQTAKTRLIDAWRKYNRRRGESCAPAVCRVADRTSSEGPVTKEDSKQWLRGVVARLRGDYSDVVRLCGLDGLTYSEASERLDTTPEAVRKKYRRAMDLLSHELSDREE